MCFRSVAIDFSISYAQNCTVSRYHFFKNILGRGLGMGHHQAPPQIPPPASSRALPSVQASPSVLGCFAPSTRASPLNSPLQKANLDPLLTELL